MAAFKTWIRAARPRTVLLSFSGVLLGGFLAIAKAPEPVEGPTPWLCLFFCALTAVLLQILSNLANDYGDFKKGTDSAKRIGPQREMQSGAITEKEMRLGIAVVSAMCLVSGALIFVFARLSWQELAVFAALGIASVLAALLYTLGKHPYGYHGLGDVFCFLFFGWVAVAGTYYLATKRVDAAILLPATAMGCLSVAVLNINNMRDYENDKANGKNTLVVKMGLNKAFIYHVFLIVLPFLCLTVFLLLKHAAWYAYAFWLMLPFFLMDLITIRKKLATGVPDRMLPKQVVKSFLLIFLFVFLFLML